MCLEGRCVLELLVDQPNQWVLREVHLEGKTASLSTRQRDMQR